MLIGYLSRFISLSAFTILTSSSLVADVSYKLESPKRRLSIIVEIGAVVEYSVALRGRTVIKPSEIGLTFSNKDSVEKHLVVKSIERTEVNQVYEPPVPRKRLTVEDHYKEITITFEGGIRLRCRAYEDAVAYRWESMLTGESTIRLERATFSFVEDAELWFPREKSLRSSQERVYERTILSEVSEADFASTGLVVGFKDGVKVYLSEADLRSYPGMFLRGDAADSYTLVGKFANYALKVEPYKDRTIEVVKRADFLAKTSGTRTYPWRVAIVADADEDLLLSETIDLLAPPCRVADTSWIKPGKVAWEWWNALNLRGVDFKAGINTATYKHFIDFAAEHGIEYIILDAGWSEKEDLMAINPDVDVQAIINYGEQHDVGIILWVVWRTLDSQLTEALDEFAEWGVAGIKVDYMEHDHQQMVEFYWRVAEEAARRRLLVDFHGSYKPTGLRRTFPNIITREGVHGLEVCKWAKTVTPEHNVTLPFTRMVAGPMDYTPGAMRNAHRDNFHPIYDRPMSQGTRCHQLAMFVVFESPLQMLCDSPSNYREEPECMAFLSEVPTVWDQTVVLEARISDYVAVARRKDKKWFIGVMTDDQQRDFNLDLSFLPPGKHRLRAWEDGLNADKHAEDFRLREEIVEKSERLGIHLESGGGWVAIIQ